jgi:hypothetical protein
MEIVFFLFGILAVLPTIILALHGREQRTYTMHVYHYHHQERPQERYQVITGSSSAYVVDTHSGERFSIVKPTIGRG